MSIEASHNKNGSIPHFKTIKIDYAENYVNIRWVDISNVGISYQKQQCKNNSIKGSTFVFE